LLNAVCIAYCQATKKKLAFYFTDELSLQQFTTTKVDVKKGLLRTPKQQPKLMDPDDLRALDFSPQTQIPVKQVIVSMSAEDLEVIKVIGRGSIAKVKIPINPLHQ
jgi:hypothetical protein